MKILVNCPRMPHALGKADSMTVFRLVEYLAQRHEIALATFCDGDREMQYVEDLKKICSEVVTVPLNRKKAYFNMLRTIPTRTPLQNAYYADGNMRSAVNNLIESFNPDLVYVHLIRMAMYAESLENIPRILAMQISQTLNYQRMVANIDSFIYRSLYRVELSKVKAYEPYIMQKYDSCLLISEHDKNAIQGSEKFDNVFYSPHGVDVEFFSRTPSRPRDDKSILFCGVLETPTNQDAVLNFYNNIFPLVKKRVPDIKFTIVGRNPPKSITQLGELDDSVTVAGSVDDVRPYYDSSLIGVAPIRIGAGLQNKLLIGMSMGQAMVATNVANEGIQATHEKNALLADSPDEFADAIVELVLNPDKANTIARNAREYVESKWTWEYYFDQLEQHMLQLVANQ